MIISLSSLLPQIGCELLAGNGLHRCRGTEEIHPSHPFRLPLSFSQAHNPRIHLHCARNNGSHRSRFLGFIASLLGFGLIDRDFLNLPIFESIALAFLVVIALVFNLYARNLIIVMIVIIIIIIIAVFISESLYLHQLFSLRLI